MIVANPKETCKEHKLILLSMLAPNLDEATKQELLDSDCEEFLDNLSNAIAQNSNNQVDNSGSSDDFDRFINYSLFNSPSFQAKFVSTLVKATIDTTVRTVKKFLAKAVQCEPQNSQVLYALPNAISTVIQLGFETLKQNFNVPDQIIAQMRQTIANYSAEMVYKVTSPFIKGGLIKGTSKVHIDKVSNATKQKILAGFTKTNVDESKRQRIVQFFKANYDRAIANAPILKQVSKVYLRFAVAFIINRLKIDEANDKVFTAQFTSKELYDWMYQFLASKDIVPASIHSFRNMLSKYVIPALEALSFQVQSSRQGYFVTISKDKLQRLLSFAKKQITKELMHDPDNEISRSIALTIEKKLARKDNLLAKLLGQEVKTSKNRSQLSEVLYALGSKRLIRYYRSFMLTPLHELFDITQFKKLLLVLKSRR